MAASGGADDQNRHKADRQRIYTRVHSRFIYRRNRQSFRILYNRQFTETEKQRLEMLINADSDMLIQLRRQAALLDLLTRSYERAKQGNTTLLVSLLEGEN